MNYRAPAVLLNILSSDISEYTDVTLVSGMNPQSVSPDKGARYASKARNGISENVKAYGDNVAKHKRDKKMLAFAEINLILLIYTDTCTHPQLSF